MQRLPRVLIDGVQLTTTSSDTASAAIVNAWATINAFTLNNTTATARLVTINIIPSAGALGVTNELVTTITVPAAGAPPTIVSGLIGHHLEPGDIIQMKADAATAITPKVSAYVTTA